jgi:hypothetical protein
VPLLVPLFLPERLEVPLPTPSSYLALPQERSKIAPTTSSPKAWLVAMSRSSLVVRAPLHGPRQECPNDIGDIGQLVALPREASELRGFRGVCKCPRIFP